MTVEDIGPAALSIASFCAWAAISRAQVYREVRAGRLVMRKIGTKSVIRMVDAKAWLDALPISLATSPVRVE